MAPTKNQKKWPGALWWPGHAKVEQQRLAALPKPYLVITLTSSTTNEVATCEPSMPSK